MTSPDNKKIWAAKISFKEGYGLAAAKHVVGLAEVLEGKLLDQVGDEIMFSFAHKEDFLEFLGETLETPEVFDIIAFYDELL